MNMMKYLIKRKVINIKYAVKIVETITRVKEIIVDYENALFE